MRINDFMIAEEKDPKCSPAVLQACRFAKSAVYKEHGDIKAARGQNENIS